MHKKERENGNVISYMVNHLSIITKILLMIGTAMLIPLMFPRDGASEKYDYVDNGYWHNNDLVAPFDFNVIKPQEEIDKEYAAAKSDLLLYYAVDSNAYSSAVKHLERISHTHAGINQRVLRHRIDSIYTVGYLQVPADMPDFERHTLILLDGNIGSEHTSNEYICEMDITDTLLRDSILVPSLVYDANRTQLELDSRLSQLTTATELVHHGDLIVAKGEYITPETALKIQSLEAENNKLSQTHYSPFGRYVGQIILCIIAFMALYMFMKITDHPILENNKKVAFVLVLILLLSAVTAFVVRIAPEWVLIVPLCIIPITMRVFFDMRVALYVHVTTIIILANMVPNSFEYIFYQLIAGMMSIVTVRNFERRSKFFLVCGVIFITYSLIYTFGVLSQESNLTSLTSNRFIVFFLNAVLTLLSYPLIWIFEKVFGFTTNLTLFELSSTNTPLLRELSRSAPGTFQHSMQVANISEDLVNEIGGNALLAKVGALYHDIGKIKAPMFFTENQISDFNPHDELEYEESAQIIIKHVLDGVTLANEYRLPEAIIDFIRQHHGTSVTGYFYNKQLQEHPNDVHIDSFRYHGPNPATREAAVVMIVDSVEAACKSLTDHSKEAIEKRVDQVINGKINEQQLHHSDLTFDDLAKIRRMLKAKMMSIYHARIAYPVNQQ